MLNSRLVPVGRAASSVASQHHLATQAAHRAVSSSSSSSSLPPPSPPSTAAERKLYGRCFKAAAYGSSLPMSVEDRTAGRYISSYADQGYVEAKSRGEQRSPVLMQGEERMGKVEKKEGQRYRAAMAGKGRRSAGRGKRMMSTSAIVGREKGGAREYSGGAVLGSSMQGEVVRTGTRVGGPIPMVSKAPTARSGRPLGPPAVKAATSAPVIPSTGGTLEIGCWAECRRGGTISSSGIYLGTDALLGSLILLNNRTNAFEPFRPDDVTFVIPRVVPLDTAVAAFKGGISCVDSHNLLQLLRRFDTSIESATKVIVAQGAKDIYARIVEERVTVTAREALEVLGVRGQKGTMADWVTNLAMHRLLIADPEHFIADPIQHSETGKYKLREAGEVESFEKVRAWSRGRTAEMTGFAERAAAARQWGREHLPVYAGAGGKSGLKKWELPRAMRWTTSDLAIIQFLRRALDHERLIQPQPYMAIAPSIVKLVEKFGNELPLPSNSPHPSPSSIEIGRPRIMAFLAEIGDTAPWENWVAHEGDDGMFQNWTPNTPPPRPSSVPSASPRRDMFAIDVYDSVRKDFGLLPVYTIDDPGAMELDDGISIETAPPTSSGTPTWWVHVHVADPTALLHPTHEVSLIAKTRDHTEYFPEKTWGMLPDWFVKDKGMSLGSLEGEEQKVLTFSARVDEGGNVLETDVKAGVVRVVRRLTYAAVNELLGYEVPPPSVVLTSEDAGAASPKDDSTPPIPSRHTDDALLATDTNATSELTTLHRLASGLFKRRVADDAIFWNFPSSSVSVSPTLSHHYTTTSTPNFYVNSPLVSLRLPSTTVVPAVTPAQLLVSEWMVTANRAAARFCVEQSVPIPFRSQAVPVATTRDLATLLAARNMDSGEVDVRDLLKNPINFAPATLTVTPAMHWPMGIKDAYGYVKVTSPLRRYSDMYAHWQIKAALLPTSSRKLPFSTVDVQRSIGQFGRAAKARGKLDRPANAFWSLYVLDKKFEQYKSTPGVDPFVDHLLSNLTCLALRDPLFSLSEGAWLQPVVILELGLRAQLQARDGSEGPLAGQEAKVKLKEIVLSGRSRCLVELRR